MGHPPPRASRPRTRPWPPPVMASDPPVIQTSYGHLKRRADGTVHMYIRDELLTGSERDAGELSAIAAALARRHEGVTIHRGGCTYQVAADGEVIGGSEPMAPRPPRPPRPPRRPSLPATEAAWRDVMPAPGDTAFRVPLLQQEQRHLGCDICHSTDGRVTYTNGLWYRDAFYCEGDECPACHRARRWFCRQVLPHGWLDHLRWTICAGLSALILVAR